MVRIDDEVEDGGRSWYCEDCSCTDGASGACILARAGPGLKRRFSVSRGLLLTTPTTGRIKHGYGSTITGACAICGSLLLLF